MRAKLFVILGLLWSTPLAAQQDDAHARMVELNEEGAAAFAAGEWELAATKFRAAYAIEPDVAVQKNEALAWFKAKRCDQAIGVSRAALSDPELPPAEYGDLRSVVANCKVDLAHDAIGAKAFDLAVQLLIEASSDAQDDYTRDRITVARVALAKAQTKPEENPAVDVEAPAEPRAKATSKAPGWTLVVASAAILGSNIAYHIVTMRNQREFLELADTGSPGDQARYDQLAKRLRLARVLLPILYGVGGATAGVGAFLLIQRSSEREPEVSGGVHAVVEF